MSDKKSKNDKAWEYLFEKYDILNQIDMNGIFNISATQIKESKREPRLMAKFDHTIKLPTIFSKNKLSILPITRGDYAISHFDSYHKFETINTSITKVSIPSYIQSLNYNNITSESMALNCAIATGIIEDFTNDTQLLPTVSGRMGSGTFDFDITDIKSKSPRHIKVINSQIEIDAAYEGIKNLSLFEAKRDLSEDFIVRQLYYPFRLWNAIVTKPVKPIFLVYSNSIYHLYEYMFENPSDYNSLILVKQKNYSIEDTSITVEDIQNILYNTKIVKEPNIAFPQADNFKRVINLCELLNEHPMSKNEVTEKYAFDVRQTDYYTNAARYLGLLCKDNDNNVPVYHLNKDGKKIISNRGFKQRQLDFCKCILSHQIFSDVLKIYFNTGNMPSNNYIVQLMKKANLYNVSSESTYERRSSTIKGWIDWIVSLINE